MAWIVVVWFWVAGLRAGGALAAAVARANTPGDEESLTQFRQAQLEYLKGHWVEAESQLRRLLARTPGDVEAWLLLASVQRRTERPDEARRSLKALVELSGSAIWAEEVQRELAKIQQLERELRNKTKGPLSQAA
jgi:predicted Zn-dependent protease